MSLRVFISYRRDDTAGHAGRLHDALATHLEVAQVFMDIGDIEPGVDFTVAIAEAIGSCDVMLALIGPRWTTVTAADGSRRLDDPNDHVVAEIAAALEMGVRVIPTLIDGAAMPEAASLPRRIADLSRRNAVDLSSVTWRSDFETLVEALRRLLPPSDAPPPPAWPEGAVGHRPRARRFPAWAAVAAVLAVLLAVVAVVASRGGSQRDQEQKQEPDLAQERLAVEPGAGRPGTTIDVFGGPCRPRPAGWSSGRIFFGIADPRAVDAIDDPDKGEVPLDPGAPWRGQLTIPDDASTGPYFVYANCWAESPGGEFQRFGDYESVEFTVE